MAQKSPKITQNSPKMTQNCPNWPKNDPKLPKWGKNDPKISTGQEKLAPTGRHGRHVFATLFLWNIIKADLVPTIIWCQLQLQPYDAPKPSIGIGGTDPTIQMFCSGTKH